MTALRYVYVLALVVWLGGMVTIGGVVAPVTFGALEQNDPFAGRVRAASVVGEVLRQFHTVSYVAGAMMLSALVLMKLVGTRPPGFGLRLAIMSAMLVASLLSGLVVDRRISRLRETIGAPVASLAPTDPDRVTFGRLHALSTSLMGLAIAGGLALCFWETRE